MQIFITLLPIFSIFIIGFIGQKILKLDIANLSKLSIYILSPFLTFKTFYSHPLGIDYLYYFIFALSIITISIILIYIWSFVVGYSIKEKSALVLASSFMNAGNYGTPVVLFFFGETCFNVAIIIMIIQQFLMGTIGMYYAVRGSSYIENNNIWLSLKKVATMPTTYGAILGVTFQLMHISIAANIMEVIRMLGDSSIPIIMIILGMQLSMLRIKHLKLSKLSFALINKIVIAPLVATVLICLLPLNVEIKRTLVVLASMPSAANTTLLAVQFNTDPEFVSSATLFSTILSLLYLPVVISLVKLLIV